MDVLKSARRVIRSPSVSKQPWHAAKHKKLPENWTDMRETLVDGMTFNLRYMGMTLVDQPKGEDVSAAAIRRITATAKAGGKKLLKVSLTVSPQEMLIYDRISNQLLECISIYRMSYCTVDKTHNKVFAYIAQNQQNETLECHAFLCAKKKVAQAVTLTVAQAFNLAFESWQLDHEEKEEKPGLVVETSNNTQPDVSVSLLSLNGTDAVKENLLDFEDCPKVQVENSENLENHLEIPQKTENNIIWEVNDGLDEAFSRYRDWTENERQKLAKTKTSIRKHGNRFLTATLKIQESLAHWEKNMKKWGCSLESFEYCAGLPSPVLTPRSWTLG